MSKTIWKYKLPRDGQTIEIHEYIVEVLHIAAQDGVPTLWAIVDPEHPREGYTEIVAWGTGWPLPDDVYQECEYWGTCGDAYGYIWHYFAEARFPDRTSQTNVDWNELSSAQVYPEYLKGYSLILDDDYPQATLSVTAPSITLSSSSADTGTVTIDMEELKKMLSTTFAEGCCTATSSACCK